RRARVGAVGPVLVEDRAFEILGIDAELRLGMFVEERYGRGAVEVGGHARAEGVGQVLGLEHLGGDGDGDPQNLLRLLHLLRERHRLGTRIDAEDDVDLLLADETLGLVEGDIDLALRIALDRLDLVLAEPAPVKGPLRSYSTPMRMGEATDWAKARVPARGPAAASAADATEYLSTERRVVLDIFPPGIAARGRDCKRARGSSRPFALAKSVGQERCSVNARPFR